MFYSITGAIVLGIIGIFPAAFVGKSELDVDPAIITVGFAVVGAIAGAAEAVVQSNRATRP